MILVVDDDDRVRTMIIDALWNLGFEAAGAPDGPAALSLVGSRRFDAAILDFLMPGMNGVELAYEIAAVDPELPIIFASAFADEVVLTRTLGRKVPVVHKPFKVSELTEVVKLVVRQQQASPP